jgi:Fur family ferric uptake transcriptional regulator
MTHHATQTLQDLGYRLTPQRTLVWDVLRTGGGHMSAEDICGQVQKQFPHVNISTVYRTLELLVELRLVRETHLGPTKRFFEVEEEVPHHHLVCEACGAVAHIHDEDLGDLQRLLADGQGFTAKQLTIFGLCAACRGAVCGGGAAGRGSA